MFDRLNDLKAQRDSLTEQLASVKTEIENEFERINAAVSAMRDDIAPFGRDPHQRPYVIRKSRSAESRARMSAAIKAKWAEKKAAGLPWSDYHNRKQQTNGQEHPIA